MGGVNRRAVLSYSLGIGAAAAAGIMRKDDDARARAAAARPFHAPRVLRSAGGLLDVALTARTALVDVGARRPADTYTYDGLLPGRTWEVRGGDTLRVRLRNRLPPLSAAAGPAAAGGPADRPRRQRVPGCPARRGPPPGDRRAGGSPGRHLLVSPASSRRGRAAGPGRDGRGADRARRHRRDRGGRGGGRAGDGAAGDRAGRGLPAGGPGP